MRLQPTSRRARDKSRWRCIGFKWPRPSLAAETPCEADAYSRAASRRGCTRLRKKPLAGEPRRSALSLKTGEHLWKWI